MKQVWKCNFCSHTEEEKEKMEEHEERCSWDPKFKKCYTCEHRTEDGYDYLIPGCDKDLDIVEGEENGNCTDWEKMK